MCVIAISLGEKVSREVFERMWRSNDDGFGLVYRARGGVGIVKGIMDEEEAWEAYAQLPEGVPHVLHFRLATHGGVRPELTHPFVVSEESSIVEAGVVTEPVLAHNGVWGLYAAKQRELKLGGPVSDSRVLAAWLGRLAKERPLREVLEENYYEIVSAGRVVVVDPATWKIYVVGDWIREGPFLFSNGSYREDRFGLLKGACDWKEKGLDLDLDFGVGVLKGPSAPKDLAEIAPPEPGPASLEEVEVAVCGGEGFSLGWSPRVRRKGGREGILRQALLGAAEEEGIPELVEYLEFGEYDGTLGVQGLVGFLEAWPPKGGGLWDVVLWDGTRAKEARSGFLATNPLLREFVRREGAVLRFLEAAGVWPGKANLTSYGNVYGWRVDENGMFVSPEGAVTPEEAARWLWLEDDWDYLLGEEEAEEAEE
jgi:hypothetical protein